MSAEWERVVGFPDYMVSNSGYIWSNKTNRILKPHICSKGGYSRVILRKKGRSFSRTIHRTVAEAFIPNPDNLPCINHIDENKQNNLAANLEWCTHEQNMNHGTVRQRIKDSIDYKAIGLKNSKKVRQFDLLGNLVKVWASANECMRSTGFDNSSIAKCCRGEMKSAYGYRWRYG